MTAALPLLPSGRRRVLVPVLVTLVASVAMLTYSGRIESGDSFYLFDAVSSAVEFGDFRLDLSAGTRPPQMFLEDALYPLNTVDAEPLQIWLATPLYALARLVPGVGLAHAVWLFNVLVSAAAAGVLFVYALALGYSERTALLAGLALALGTILLVYTKTFFREPLALLMLLAAACAAERWRASGYRLRGALALLLAALLGAWLTKATTLLALPALVVIVVPALPLQRWLTGRVVIGLFSVGGLALLLFAALALFGEQLGVGDRYNPLTRIFDSEDSYLVTALHSYLVSPGGSVWGTSPVTLLAFGGAWLLWRARRPRYILVGALALLGYAVGHAAASGQFWFGGLSWPPRFLLPVVPFLVLLVLPVIERIFARPVRPALAVVVALIAAYSLWVQFTGVSLWFGAYTEALPREARGLLEWGGGLNTIAWLRPVVIPQLWSRLPFDFAWVRMNAPLWALALAALALVCALVLVHVPAQPSLRLRRAVWLLPLAWLACTAVGLRAVYVDTYYFPDRDGLFELLPILNAETERGDIVLLSNREYERFFLNYGRLDGARLVTLDNQPGDKPSAEQDAERVVVSGNPDALTINLTKAFIHSLAEGRTRLWLVDNRSDALPWAVRSVERYMSTHLYPLRVIQTGATVRLIEYSTVPAPDPTAYRSPERATDLAFDALRLDGYTLPLGTDYRPGDALPIALSWRAHEAPPADYRVALFLRAADGSPVAQGWDSRPAGDFAATSGWRVGVPHWDPRALRIPADAAPGSYQLWLKVYWLDAAFAPQDAPASGRDVHPDLPAVGVLPVTITITDG